MAVLGIRQWTGVELAEDAIPVAGDEIVSGVAQEFWEEATEHRDNAPATAQFPEHVKRRVRARQQVLFWLATICHDVERI